MKYPVVILGSLMALAILVVATIWFFYAEEDARGAREWDIVKKNLQIGESVDFHDLIPPEIPDDQNLGAIPLLAPGPVPKAPDYTASNALKNALAKIDPNSDMPTHTKRIE